MSDSSSLIPPVPLVCSSNKGVIFFVRFCSFFLFSFSRDGSLVCPVRCEFTLPKSRVPQVWSVLGSGTFPLKVLPQVFRLWCPPVSCFFYIGVSPLLFFFRLYCQLPPCREFLNVLGRDVAHRRREAFLRGGWVACRVTAGQGPIVLGAGPWRIHRATLPLDSWCDMTNPNGGLD